MVMAMLITTVIWFKFWVSFRLLEVIVSFWFSFQKMYAYPVFRCQSATSTRLLMAPSAEAKRLETVESGRTTTVGPVLQNPEEEDRLVEQVNDQDLQDEGFEEEILEDITVPVLYEDEDRPSSLPLPQSPEPSTSSGGEGQHLAPSVLSQPSDNGGSLSDEAQVRHFKGFV